jgi:hypothetical protein
LNPLVKWIWLGGAIVVMGTFVALLPNRRTVMVLAGTKETATVSELGTVLAPARPITLREGHD